VCPHDPRWVAENGALEAIATSTGQNDAGLFEVSFQDARYLPFEYHGAVSRWRIELPHENNYFEMDSLSDVVLNINYTAREGGEALRRAARAATECDLPGAGWCLFDLRHDFADAWELFRRQEQGDEEGYGNRNEHEPEHERGREHEHEREREREREREQRHRRHFALDFRRGMFPFVPGERELFIETMVLLFDRPEHCGCECPAECPCCSNLACTQQELELRGAGLREERKFRCMADEEWPGRYHGVITELCIGPLRERRDRVKGESLQIVFPRSAGEVESAYVLCRYSLKDRCCPRPEERKGEMVRRPAHV
jgi:hypothetical protein